MQKAQIGVVSLILIVKVGKFVVPLATGILEETDVNNGFKIPCIRDDVQSRVESDLSVCARLSQTLAWICKSTLSDSVILLLEYKRNGVADLGRDGGGIKYKFVLVRRL